MNCSHSNFNSSIGNCFCCQDEIDSKHFECGHVIAKSKGGDTSIDNLRPVCSLCNKSMGTKNMMVYMEQNNFLK